MSCTTTQAINHKSSQPAPSALDPSPQISGLGKVSAWRLMMENRPHNKSPRTPRYLPRKVRRGASSAPHRWLPGLIRELRKLRTFALRLKSSMWKLKNVSFSQRRSNVNTEKQPSRMTFSLEVITVLSEAAFISIQTNYIRGNTHTRAHTHTHTHKSCMQDSLQAK